jgi:hypothetical protein
MEDVICVRVKDGIKGPALILTWGRIFEDEKQLTAALSKGLSKFGFQKILSLRVCPSLRDGVKAQYFYEGFFYFCTKPIPFGSRYSRWKAKMRKDILAGREIFLISSRAKIDRPARLTKLR